MNTIHDQLWFPGHWIPVNCFQAMNCNGWLVLSFPKLWFSLHQQVASVPTKVEALVHQEGKGKLFPGKLLGLLFQVKVRVPSHYFGDVFLVNFWDHSMKVNIWRHLLLNKALRVLFTDYWFSEHQQGALVVY